MKWILFFSLFMIFLIIGESLVDKLLNRVMKPSLPHQEALVEKEHG